MGGAQPEGFDGFHDPRQVDPDGCVLLSPFVASNTSSIVLDTIP